MWFSIACPLIDNNICHPTGQNVVCFGRESTAKNIYTPFPWQFNCALYLEFHLLVLWENNICLSIHFLGNGESECITYSSPEAYMSSWSVWLATLFLGTKLGILGHQFYAQIWAKIGSKLHMREYARASLHPNMELFKLKKPQLQTRVKRFKVTSFCPHLMQYEKSNCL